MDTKHTPGPWGALPEECDKPYVRIRGTRLGGRYKVANVLTPVYEGVHAREAEETRANASLIAAAPELLEALEKFVKYNDAEHMNDVSMMLQYADALECGRAAIAKATGEQE
jgi:hypothetical protein